MDGVVRADAALGLEGRKLLVSGRGIRLLINKVDDREVTALGTEAALKVAGVAELLTWTKAISPAEAFSASMSIPSVVPPSFANRAHPLRERIKSTSTSKSSLQAE